MAKIPQEIIDEVLRRADMVAVVGRYTQLRKQGNSWSGLCPIHGEKTPSFRITPEKGVFHCFGCGAGGGLLQFLMKVEHTEFVETVQKLGAEVGVEVRVEERTDPEEMARKRRFELLERCSHYYHELLVRSPLGREGLEYLHRRGLGQGVIEHYRLGWAPPSGTSLMQRLQTSGYHPDEGVDVGVLHERNGRVSDTLRGRVVFPISDVQDRVVAFGGRVLDDRHPKYLNTPETAIYSKRRHLFGLAQHRQAVSRADRAVVVEGYLDVLALAQVDVKLAVASLGTALTPEQAALLRRYTQNVTLAYDADKAGQNATVKAIELFEQANLRVSVAMMPPGEDPDSLAAKEGKSGIEQMVADAVGLVEFLIAYNEKRFDVTTAEGKEDFLSEVLPALDKLGNVSRQDVYVVRIAKLLSMSETILWQQLRQKSAKTDFRGRVQMAKVQRGKIDSRMLEARLFRVCVYHPEWFGQVRSRMSPELITSDRLRPLFAALWRAPERDQALQLQDLVPYLEDPESLTDLTELLLEPPPRSVPDDVEKLVEDLRSKWDKLRLERLRREVVPALEAGELQPDDERFIEYQQLLRRTRGGR